MKKALLFGMILLCLSLLAIMSCNDKSTSDDDDDADSGQDDDNDDNDTLPSGCDDDTAYDPTLCADNVPPVPLSAEVEINGQIVETPVTIHYDDEVTVYLEYEDENCNLAGGTTYIMTPDGMTTWPDVGFPEEVGCSSAETGEPLKIDLLPSFFWYQPVSIGLRDGCNAYSTTRIPLDITTVEY